MRYREKIPEKHGQSTSELWGQIYIDYMHVIERKGREAGKLFGKMSRYDPNYGKSTNSKKRHMKIHQSTS